jgi:hypothetical protein
MRIFTISGNIYFTCFLFLIIGGCEKVKEDPCLKSKWLQSKELEIKLAVHVSTNNPNLPGGISGSLNPIDFQKMMVNGTIQKIECNEQTSELVKLGNSYIDRSVDFPANIEVPGAWWIGHVVYVYEFGNDKDHLSLNLTIKITMDDNQSYICDISKETFYPQIVQESGKLYYYILIEVYSDNWNKF